MDLVREIYYDKEKQFPKLLIGKDTKNNISQIWKFYPNGQQKSIKNYKNGRLDADSYEYYETGILKSYFNHKDGVLNGLFEKLYPNGQTQETGYYLEAKFTKL